MDFTDRIKDSINSIEGLPLKIRKGYLSAKESLVVYPLPGSQVVAEYYDGIKDQQLNYEIAMKSENGDKIEQALWLISDHLEQLDDIKSNNKSFEFDYLIITSKPFINDADEQGWFVFLLDFQVKLTTFKEEK